MPERRGNHLVVLIAFVCIGGCGGDHSSPTTPPVTNVTVTGVTVTGPATLTTVGEKAQYAATGSLSNGTTQDLTGSAQWLSTDPNVVSIPVQGLVTVTGGGTASVQAMIQQFIGTRQVQVVPGPPALTTGTAGRIDNVQTVADLITYHQDAVAGSAFRVPGLIARWELPVRVYVEPAVSADNVQQALAYWQSVTGLSYSMITSDAEPRVLVRATTEGLFGSAEGSGVIDATYQNNRARSGFVRIRPDLAACDFAQVSCALLFKRAIANVLGIFGQVPGGLSFAGSRATTRETNLLVELYRLPHGTHISADGTWGVAR